MNPPPLYEDALNHRSYHDHDQPAAFENARHNRERSNLLPQQIGNYGSVPESRNQEKTSNTLAKSLALFLLVFDNPGHRNIVLLPSI